MKFFAAVILAFLGSASAVAGEPFSLKGVALGAPADKAQLAQALGFTCSGDICTGADRCVASCGYGMTSIAGASAEVGLVIDHQHVQQISARFSSLKFADVAAAFESKYGKPSAVNRSRAQSAGGAQLDNVVETGRIPLATRCQSQIMPMRYTACLP